MCAGAIVNARIKNVFFAVKDVENGGITRFNISNSTMNHTTNAVWLNEYEDENKNIIQTFFKEKRKKH